MCLKKTATLAGLLPVKSVPAAHSIFPHGSFPSHLWLAQVFVWPFKHFETMTIMEPTAFSTLGADGARHLLHVWKSSNRLLSNTKNFLPYGAVSSSIFSLSSSSSHLSSTSHSDFMSSRFLKLHSSNIC